MARRGRRIAGRGGHRGQRRGGHRGGLRGRSRSGHRGGHHAHGHERVRYHEGARGRWPRVPGRRRPRGQLRQRASARRGESHRARRTAKSKEARDDMNFVDEADKPSAAIADAIDEGSSSSSEEYVEGPPLEVEAVKKKQEEEVRKQKEAEIREQEEKARQLKEAQEQEENEREEARKKEEEEKRHEELGAKKRDYEEARRWRKEQRKEDEETRRRREERKRQEAEVRRRRERLWDEEEYARRRFEERRRDEEDEIRRLKQERRRLDQTNAIRQLEQESQSLEEQEAAAKEETSVSEKAGLFSPMTKHIMEVVSNVGKNSTKTERPATVEASTETDNDLFYQRPEQVPMRNQEVQAGPVKQPVASYLIKRPRSEARLQRLLSFFGLVSPEEPEQEVIEYNFIDSTAISSRCDDQQHKPVRHQGPYQEWKSGKRKVWQDEKEETPENSQAEEKPDKLDAKTQEQDASKQRKKRRAHKKSSKPAPGHDVQKVRIAASTKTAEIRPDQADKPKVRTTEGTGAAQRVRGEDSVEEINEEIMEPQRDHYGRAVGPWLRKMHIVRPLETLSASTSPRQRGAQASSSQWKNRPEPIIDELWTCPRIGPSAQQAAAELIETGFQQEFTAQSPYPTYVSAGAHMPQTVPIPWIQFKPSLMSHTQSPWDIRQPFPAGHGYYVKAEQAPYCQAQYTPIREPLEQAVCEHSPRQCTHTKFPSRTLPNGVCTCVVKCGDHCVGLGGRRGDFIEPLEPSLRSSISVFEHESARRFEDTTTTHSEPNLEDERHAREDIEARIRAEEEVRILTCKLRLLEAERYEGKSRFDELHEEEEALQLEREMLQIELDRLKKQWQVHKWQQRHDQGLTQLSRIEERLRLLEQGQNVSKKGTPWTTLAELPSTVPFTMPMPYAFSPYGLPAQQVPTYNTSWWTRQRGHRARRCSDAGSGSSGSPKAGTSVFPNGREAAIKTQEGFDLNSKTLFEDKKKSTNSAKQDQQQSTQDTAFFGMLIPLFSLSSSFADQPTGKNVLQRQVQSESKLESLEGITKTGLEPTSIDQRGDAKIEYNTARKQGKSNEDNLLAFDDKALTTIPPKPEVPEVFGNYRQSKLPKRTHPSTPLRSYKALSTEVSSLLSGLSESDDDSPRLMKQKVKSRKGRKRARKEPDIDISNSLSDSSNVSPVQLTKAGVESNRSVSSSPKPKESFSWTSARNRLAGVLMPTSLTEDCPSKTPSGAPVSSIATRKPKLVGPRKPLDELSLSEIENEQPYTTEDFTNEMKGESAEKLRDAISSRSAELDSLRLDDLAEGILQSKSADSDNALHSRAPKPPPVAVRSKMSKGTTKMASENVNDDDVQLLESSREKPLPLSEMVAEYCEHYQQSAQSVPQLETKLSEKTSTRKNSAHRSEINTSAVHNGSVLVCNVLMPCIDEVRAEKEIFEIMETPQDIFRERSFVSFVSVLTILWITIVLSTTTFLSPKLKADVRKGTIAVTRALASSYTQPRTSANTTQVPSFYLCDSDYCVQEGNFLKSLLSEADYPCEDFYEHICQRWTQRRSAEATRRGTISEDVFLEDRMARILLSSFKDNAAAVKPAVKFIRICKNSAFSSSVHEVREVFKHWRIREWPVRSYEERHREDAWLFAGELLRDMGLPVLADVYVAVDPFNERKGVTTLKPPEALHFPRDTVPDLVDRALKEALRSFNINDPSHIERLADEVLVVFDVVEHLAGDKHNSTMVKDCELDHDVIKLLSTAVEYNSNRTGSITCKGATYVQLFSAKYFEKLPEELRRVAGNALLNHLGFRALVRLAAFMPDSLHALRELSYLEITGRSEVPDVDNLCLRAMEEILPLCLVKAAALPLIHNGVALWQRRWLSDLEFTFLHALPRVPWLGDRALFALAFRLRQIRVDLPFSIDQFRENDECLPGDLKVGNRVTDILGLFREMRTRRTILELRFGPEGRPLSPLKMWPYFDASLRRVRIPQGLLNNSVPANSSIFAFHLSRVAVRYYATMAPLLYTSFENDGEATLDVGRESKRLFEVVQRCLEEDWRALSELDAAGLPTQYGLLDHRAWWLRRWLLGQTLAIEMALHAFRELLDVRRIRKLQYRFVTLPDYTSTQLFFMYYALDHCERDYEGFERRQILQRKRPPAKMRVNLPLRHVVAFANAFGCRRGDQMRADQQCTTFLH